MKHLYRLALFIVTIGLLTTLPAFAGHDDDARDAANALEKEADKLRSDFKDYLKDIRHWEPRGQEGYLYNSMKSLKDTADDLSNELKDGWGRKAYGKYNEVQACLEAVGRSIGLARDRNVQRRWQDVREAADRLSRLAQRGNTRDYRDYRGSDDRDYRNYRQQSRGGDQQNQYIPQRYGSGDQQNQDISQRHRSGDQQNQDTSQRHRSGDQQNQYIPQDSDRRSNFRFW